MSKFSIIVPAYNTADYVGQCLDSIAKAASYSGLAAEVVCVDDGSKDGTSEVLDAYIKKRLPDNLLLNVIHVENAGVGNARNRGLAAATGDWILFVDSDDILRESALSDIATAIERHQDVDFVVFDDVKFNDADKPCWSDANETLARDMDLSKNIPDRLASVCMGGAAHRKTVLKGVVFEDYVLGEDLVFFCEVMSKARKCHFLGKAEYANRLRQGSASRSTETYRKIQDRIYYHTSMFKVILKSGKVFGRAFTHGRGNSWIESIPSLILSWPNKKERESLFLLWLKSMHMAAAMPFFSRWQRFVARLVSATQSKLAARVLCVLPYRLKCKGFHR